MTIDAMGTQAKIAEQIVAEEADYVLSLKGNHKHLFEDVQDAFTSKTYARFQHLSQNNDHGRVEKRIYTAISAEEAMIEAWAGLRSIIQVERFVYNKSKETQSTETQYYISSLCPQEVEALSGFIRGHWGIENSLHWHLGMTFREDQCRARREFSAQNLNLLRKYALSILSGQTDKLSMKKRQFKAALNIQYLKKLLNI